MSDSSGNVSNAKKYVQKNSSNNVGICISRLHESISSVNDQNYHGEEVIERNKKLAKAFLCKLQCRPVLDFSKGVSS